MRRVVALAILIAAGPAIAADNARPLWEDYPKLVCHGDTTRFCAEQGACETGRATAIFFVDFTAGTIRAAVSASVSHIINKEHYRALGYDAVFLDKRGPFVFQRITSPQSLGMTEIKGVWSEAGLPQASTMWMTCTPNL